MKGNLDSGTNKYYKSYKKDSDYSYTLGAFPTIELIKARPEIVRRVFIREAFSDAALIEGVCAAANIPVQYGDTCFNRLNEKDNCYVIGVFGKYSCALEPERPHVVLVNPGDMGNLGTIVRTVLGFNIRDVAIITPSADIFHPKTVRASMGAIFKTNFRHFTSFGHYAEQYGTHPVFPFMLNGGLRLSILDCPETKLFTLVFGNETSGLDNSFAGIGTSVKIPQSDAVDSLNLSVAVGVGAFTFACRNNLV